MMNDTTQKRLEELFHLALELPIEQRDHYVGSLTGDDAALRDSLRALLRGDDLASEEFLRGSDDGAEDHADGDDPSQAPESIGTYRIIRKIGEGGMGTVYEAEQENTRRRVALKMLRWGLTPSQVVRRFEREARVLGQLQHPGIAQVYEAGVAEVVWRSGAPDNVPPAPAARRHPSAPKPSTVRTPRQPFFAMELVRGQRLDDFVENSHSRIHERLELLARVCDAVHYAHQAGVVHRDLKPANIFVMAEDLPQAGQTDRVAAEIVGWPKVLDFGVARVISSDRQATVQTEAGQIIGTLAYMSPEQISAGPQELDHRSDIYSLGVILYELIAGKPPYEIRGQNIADAARVIREEEPSRLSSLDSRFRGDIETIVAKALEKDRTRRYQSAAELAADIRRYLRDEPIVARPASAFYHMRKFAKRNKALCGGAAATLFALIVGLAVALRQAAIATRERAFAQRQAYLANVAAATSALQNRDVVEMRQRLEAAPKVLRGWEWHYLWARLDESLRTIPIEKGEGWLALSPDGASVAWIQKKLPEAPMWDLTTGRRLPDWNKAACGLLSERRSGPAASAYWDEIDLALRVRDCRTRRDSRYGHSDLGLDVGVRTYGLVDWALSPDGRFAAFVRAKTCFVELGVGPVAEVRVGDPLQRSDITIAVSVDNRLALPTAVDGSARLWDPFHGSATRLPTDSSVVAFAFNQEGSRLAGSTLDGAIRVWDGRTGEPLAIGRGHGDSASALRYSPDGNMIASFAKDRTVRLWDAETLRPLQTFHGHEWSYLPDLQFTPDGSRLVTLDSTNSIRVWDATLRGDPYELRGHTSFVYPVAFSPDGKMLASGGWDSTVRLWDVQTGVQTALLDASMVYITALAFRADGAQLTSQSSDDNVSLWDTKTGSLLARRKNINQEFRPASFHRDGVHVLLEIDRTRRRVKFWNTVEDSEVEMPFESLRDVPDATVSHDGRYWASFGDPVTIHSLSDESSASTEFATGISAYCAFSPVTVGRSQLAVVPGGVERNNVAICDGQTGKTLAMLRGNTSEVFSAVWSPDGTRIATGGRDHAIRLWDASTFEQTAELRGHKSYVWSLAWSPDGSILASGSGDHSVRLWELRPLRDRLTPSARSRPANGHGTPGHVAGQASELGLPYRADGK